MLKSVPEQYSNSLRHKGRDADWHTHGLRSLKSKVKNVHVCVCVCVCTHGPCGRLGSAGLLEGHLEGVRTGVVGVGGDGRSR